MKRALLILATAAAALGLAAPAQAFELPAHPVDRETNSRVTASVVLPTHSSYMTLTINGNSDIHRRCWTGWWWNWNDGTRDFLYYQYRCIGNAVKFTGSIPVSADMLPPTALTIRIQRQLLNSTWRTVDTDQEFAQPLDGGTEERFPQPTWEYKWRYDMRSYWNPPYVYQPKVKRCATFRLHITAITWVHEAATVIIPPQTRRVCK